MDIGSLTTGGGIGFIGAVLINFFTRPERDGDRRAGACDRRQATCDAVHRTLTEQITTLRVQQGEATQVFKKIEEQLAAGQKNFEHLDVKIEEILRWQTQRLPLNP